MTPLPFILLFLILPQVFSQCCLKIMDRACVTCPNGTHLFRGSCLIDVDNCATYKDGFQCSACLSGYQLNTSGQCIVNTPPPSRNDSQEYVQLLIDPRSTNANNQLYTLSIDFFKSNKKQLSQAQSIGGRIRTYKVNSINQIMIQFKDQNSKFYAGLVIVDLSTFTFTEKSFSRVTTPTIPSILPKFNQVITETIDQSNSIHKQLLSIIEAEAKKTVQNLQSVRDGRIVTYPEGNFDFNLNYTTFPVTTSGDIFNLQGSVSKAKRITSLVAKQVVVGKPIISLLPLSYANFDRSNDEGYQIVIDFVKTQLSKYQQSQPSRTQRAVDKGLVYYKLTIQLADGSIWQVVVSYNSQIFILNLISDSQTNPPTKVVGVNFKKIDSSLIYQDFQFLICLDYIYKQSPKYKDSVIRAVERAEDNLLLRFRVQFQYMKFVWEISAQINKATFIPSSFQQTQKQPIENPQVAINTNSNITPPNPPANVTPPNPPANVTPPNPPANVTPPNPPANVTPPNPPANVTPNPVPGSRLPEKVQSLVTGLIEQTDQGEIRQIDQLSRNSNQNQLNGAALIGLYYSVSSFTRNYRAYYIKSVDIYQARIIKDTLRKRTYFQSFSKI